MSRAPIALNVFTKEQKICLALWRKAFREKDLELPNVQLILSTKSTALSVRMSCYRSIKPFRHEMMFDEELKLAAEHFAVTIRPLEGDAKKWILEFTPRKTLSELEAQLQSLGINDDDLLFAEEKELLGKLEGFLSTPETQAAEREETPFYKRDS